jgi:lipopolysaccharide/colanic/teichoic acid biosynthesis glycosyltransferase
MEEEVVTVAARARAAGHGSPLLVGSGHVIATTARILGPVVIHPDVSIGDHATIVGPSVIGAGARISAGTLAASTLVGPNACIPPGASLRGRVWFDNPDDLEQERPESLYLARLERFGYQLETVRALSAVPSTSRSWYLAWKRLFDLVGSFAALTVLSPVFLLVSILIRLEATRAPIFYRCEREGLRGRRFMCLKFRTMHQGADSIQHVLKVQDKLDGPHFKLDDDPRVTSLGRILRLTNIDELPQLINVLLGDMSLVGPRPSPFRENQICVPWRKGRLSTRPGMTGLWQVCRHDRESGDFHQWIEYDLLYVQQASPWLDLKILLATVVTLIARVPIPAAWLIRLPPPAAAETGEEAPDAQASRVVRRRPAATESPTA